VQLNFAYIAGFELQYRDVPPKIIAEELLAEYELPDYKFWCFNGEVKYVWIDIDRSTNHRRMVFDRDWKPLPFTMRFDLPDTLPDRPRELEKMIDIANVLSSGFPQVRVDLYCVDCKIYFGEMTFTSRSGTLTMPPEFGYQLGDWTPLPKPSPLSGETNATP